MPTICVEFIKDFVFVFYPFGKTGFPVCRRVMFFETIKMRNQERLMVYSAGLIFVMLFSNKRFKI